MPVVLLDPGLVDEVEALDPCEVEVTMVVCTVAVVPSIETSASAKTNDWAPFIWPLNHPLTRYTPGGTRATASENWSHWNSLDIFCPGCRTNS